jgi:hypothetical protein
MRLLAAVALDVGGARLAHCAAVLALRNRPSLLVDVLKWPIMMLAIANAMASHTGLASPLFSVDEHGGGIAIAAGLSRRDGGSWVRDNVRSLNELLRCRKVGGLSELQSRQGKKAKPSGMPDGRRGFETKRVATCTAQRVIAGGTARPKTSVRDAADSGIEAKKQRSFFEELEQPKSWPGKWNKK